MANPSSSNSIGLVQESNALSSHSNTEPGALFGSVAIFWDIENCPVPTDVRPEEVAGNIRMALRVHPIIKGAVTMFSAYGDFNIFPRRLREGCQRTGVKLVDVPNGRKDAADKAILVDMFLFALDNRPPSSIMLISGDVDFSPALHILGQRGYTIILVIPAGGVSSALTNAGRFVWDWPSVARAEGFIPQRPPMLDFSGFVTSSGLVENEEEAIVYRGITHCYTSLPLEASSSWCENEEEPLWIQPGDLQGLKGQLLRLLEMFGGSLPLVRVPSEYVKLYGRPLCMADYGVYKLVNLIKKLSDSFIIGGRGPKKLLCLRNTKTPILLRRENKDKGDYMICPNTVSSTSDDSSDEVDNRLDCFRMEVQELLVCYSDPIPLVYFESIYQQRYKKPLDYISFGVGGPEELFEKVREVAWLHEDQESKFLVSSCGSVGN